MIKAKGKISFEKLEEEREKELDYLTRACEYEVFFFFFFISELIFFNSINHEIFQTKIY
jgi:hypothetical protein